MKNAAMQQRIEEQNPFGNLQQSLLALSAASTVSPQDPSIWADYGVAVRCLGNLELAVALYRRSLALHPDNAIVLSNLGGALRALGKLDEAILTLEKAIVLEPNFDSALFNLALAYEDNNQLERALELYDTILAMSPERKDAKQQRAFTLLKMGDLQNGFREYEYRIDSEPILQREFLQPRWDGSPFTGKTLLLHAEQGMGDTFQFIRYATIVKSLGGTVLVECQAPTAPVVATAEGVDHVFVRGEQLPHFDMHASLMSLPHLLQTRLETIPQTVPYLTVPKSHFGKVSKIDSKSFNVGIVWETGHNDIGAHSRNVPAIEFSRLLQRPEITLYSLQVNSLDKSLRTAIECGLLLDQTAQFKDFAWTADAIRQLDLVITVDTAVAHLSAAMGKPVWVLLPYSCEWRWLRERQDSPWYPTMRLFRQTIPFDWTTVFDAVLEALKALKC